MDTNNTLIKVKKNDGEDSGSGKSDFISSKSTSKVIKSFMKSVSTLVLHVENVLSKSNGLRIVDNSSIVNDSDIDVVEHSIKKDPDDASRYLRSIKKCVLQLCLLCVDQNIYVDCDLTFNQIDFYGCLDDSTRSLVTNYLTENIGYMIEHIGFIISMFAQEKDLDEARDIRKSLQKIYKQILLIPLNTHLDEVPEVYKNLNKSLWHSESIQSLAHKLCQLRTALIKFKKVFRNRIFEQDYATDDCSIFEISLNNKAKRKFVNQSDEPNTKRLKEESNASPDHVFLVPNVPLFQNKADENGTVKKKKKKHLGNEITAAKTYENDVLIVESDTESVKKRKKNKNRSENSDIELIIPESDAESIKKKKKHKVKTENSEIESIVTESETQNIKKKHKNRSDNSDIESIFSESDVENIKKKNNHKAENKENVSIIIEKEPNNIKKKHKNKSENSDIESKISECDAENFKKKKKHENSDIVLIYSEGNAETIKKKKKDKHKAENQENESIFIEIKTDNIKKKHKKCDIESIVSESHTAKKKKHKNRSENSDIVSIFSESDAENIKKKKKEEHKAENKENESMIIHIEIDNIKNKDEKHKNSDIESKISESDVEKKKKHKNRSENSDIVSIFSESDAENIKKKKKEEHKAENKENESMIIHIETDNIKNKDEKHKNSDIESKISESDVEKKKKHKNRSENSDVSIFSESDAENIKNKKKDERKAENKENESMIIEIETDNIRNKDKKNSDENRNTSEILKTKKNDSKDKSDKEQTNNSKNRSRTESENSVKSIGKLFTSQIEIDENVISTKGQNRKSNNKSQSTLDKYVRSKKNESKDKSDKEQTNNSKNRSRTESENSVISIGKLFTSQIEIDENVISTKGQNRKSNNKSQSTLDEYVRKSKKMEKQCSDNELSHEIFGALSRGDLEIVDEDVSEEIFGSIAREANLNENEKFLYIQDLLLEAKENKELSTEMKEKLRNLSILIDWEVPPIHKIGKRLSAGPLPEEQVSLNALGVCNKSYNLDEDAIIRKNWKDFCKIHDLDENPAPFLMLKHGRKAFLKYQERKKFVQFLGKDLPNRTLNSIYRRFKVLHSDKTKLGRFSPEEDELILTYCTKVTSDRHKFAALANVLNRSRPHIERRYRILTKLHNERIHWNVQLDTTIVNELLKAVKSKKVEDLRTAEIILPHYKQVAANMQIPYEKIRIRWLKFVYPKLFSPDPIYVGPIRYKLIKMLIKSKLTDWKKIDWNEIATHFEGLTREFLWGELACIQIRVSNMNRKDLGGLLRFCEKYIKESDKEKGYIFGKRIVKRYRWSSEGQLEAYE